jgi:hypothetical protein
MNRNHSASTKNAQHDRGSTGATRKLTLQRQTLRHLMDGELRLAAGGALEIPVSGGRTCVGDDI